MWRLQPCELRVLPHLFRCCSKMPQAGSLINNLNLFLRSWSWKFQDQDTSWFDVWPEHIFLNRAVCSLHLSMTEGLESALESPPIDTEQIKEASKA